MENISGKLQTKSISKASQTKSGSLLIDFIVTFALGFIAIILHSKLRIPMHLPGHHGLIFIALLMVAKLSYNYNWSGRAFSIGVASTLLIPGLGFGDPFLALILLLPGLLIDVLFSFTSKLTKQWWLIAAFGALAYVLIPLSRIIISAVTGYPYGSLLAGYVLPIFTHLMFGALGAYLGWLAVKGINKIRK